MENELLNSIRENIASLEESARRIKEEESSYLKKLNDHRNRIDKELQSLVDISVELRDREEELMKLEDSLEDTEEAISEAETGLERIEKRLGKNRTGDSRDELLKKRGDAERHLRDLKSEHKKEEERYYKLKDTIADAEKSKEYKAGNFCKDFEAPDYDSMSRSLTDAAGVLDGALVKFGDLLTFIESWQRSGIEVTQEVVEEEVKCPQKPQPRTRKTRDIDLAPARQACEELLIVRGKDSTHFLDDSLYETLDHLSKLSTLVRKREDGVLGNLAVDKDTTDTKARTLTEAYKKAKSKIDIIGVEISNTVIDDVNEAVVIPGNSCNVREFIDNGGEQKVAELLNVHKDIKEMHIALQEIITSLGSSADIKQVYDKQRNYTGLGRRRSRDVLSSLTNLSKHGGTLDSKVKDQIRVVKVYLETRPDLLNREKEQLAEIENVLNDKDFNMGTIKGLFSPPRN